MEIKTNIYGTINGTELSNELILVNSATNIEIIKKEFIKRIFEDTKILLKDNKRYLEKNPEKKEFVKQINEFILEQFENTNIYKIKKTTSTTNEIEIIKLDEKEEYIKKLKEMTKNEQRSN